MNTSERVESGKTEATKQENDTTPSQDRFSAENSPIEVRYNGFPSKVADVQSSMETQTYSPRCGTERDKVSWDPFGTGAFGNTTRLFESARPTRCSEERRLVCCWEDSTKNICRKRKKNSNRKKKVLSIASFLCTASRTSCSHMT